jgi:hypothetical protein
VPLGVAHHPASLVGNVEATVSTMERLSAESLPVGYSFEWTGTAFQEKAASGKTAIVLSLAVLFAYLFLVARHRRRRWRAQPTCCRNPSVRRHDRGLALRNLCDPDALRRLPMAA